MRTLYQRYLDLPSFKVNLHYFIFRYNLIIGIALIICGILISFLGNGNIEDRYSLGFKLGFFGLLFNIFSCIYATHFCEIEEKKR